MKKLPVPVLLRLPPALVRKMDATAKTHGRSRNVEARMRLEESFKRREKASTT